MTAPIDPHAGLGDLDGELDVATLVQEEATGASSDDPLRHASQELRSGSDDDFADLIEDETGDEETAEEKETEAEGEEAEEAEKAEAESESEEKTDEESEEDKAEDDKSAKLFDVTIPAIAKKGGRANVNLELEGLPQEYHDLLQGHINRSQQLDVVQDQLETAREHETVARFLESQPLAALLMVDQEDREKASPSNIGAQFVELWLKQNPKPGIELVHKLKYDDPDELDQDSLRDKAEAAQLRVEKKVQEGLTKQSQLALVHQFISDTGAIIRSVAIEMKLDDDDLADFASMCGQKLKRVFDERVSKNQDPRIPKADVLNLLQPAIRRFSGEPSSGGKKKGSDKDPAKRMKRKASVAERHLKVGGGKSAGTRAAPTGLAKFKGKNRPKSIKEASKLFRAGK